MAILIANIGTSDLAVKIDEYGDYYVPIGFPKNPPNLDDSNLNETERFIWEHRDQLICSYICDSLNLQCRTQEKGDSTIYSYNFREVTKQLFDNYNNWQNKLIPCRFLGVIYKAVKDFDVKEAYIFITDQEPQHHQDSIYLFSILEQWLKDNDIDLKLYPKIIPSNIDINSLDSLLSYYHSTFNEISFRYHSEEELLISIKGGTQKMQNALQQQAIASTMQKQIFIDPQLSVKQVLAGNPSKCVFTSYWQYMKGQKYDDVRTVLESRWNFSSAKEIIEKWKGILNFLDKNIENEKLRNNQHLISDILKTLTIAAECFNLDIETAKNIGLDKNKQRLKTLSPHLLDQVSQHYNSALNLYTQCRIYEELGQSAYLLSRMGSFYDAALEGIVRRCISNKSDYPKTGNRFEKLQFINDFIKNNSPDLRSSWQEICNSFEKLDFWYSMRNQLIHSAKGISPNRLSEVYKRRMEYARNEEEKSQYSPACPPNQIVTTMAEILQSDFRLIHPNERQFIGGTSKHYIYSAARDWVIEQLQNDLRVNE